MRAQPCHSRFAPYRTDGGPLQRRCAGERHRRVLLIFGSSRAMRRSIGTSSMCAFDRHEVGIPGHGEYRFAVHQTEACWFAWLYRDAMKQQRPFAAIASRMRSRSPTELPPENTTMS